MLNPSDLLSWWRLGNTHGEVEALESASLSLEFMQIWGACTRIQ